MAVTGNEKPEGGLEPRGRVGRRKTLEGELRHQRRGGLSSTPEENP